MTPAQQALSIPTVKSANLRKSNLGRWMGTVYDETTGIEFDVRQSGMFSWWASDDNGTRHHGRNLKRAVTKAIRANTN